MAGPEFDDFPEPFRRDLESYLASLRKTRPLPGGRCSRPCKPPTINLTRAKLVAAAPMAVRCGVREMLAGDTFQKLLQLPFDLMKRAGEANYSSPKKAAVLAQMAVAIRILCVAPIRLANLSNTGSANIL